MSLKQRQSSILQTLFFCSLVHKFDFRRLLIRLKLFTDYIISHNVLVILNIAMKDYVFHGQQETTASEIIGLMVALQTFCMVLLAQMQSGKTGTYLKVALDAVKDCHADHVLIISGSRDTTLRAQTTQNLEDAINSYCIGNVNGKMQVEQQTKLASLSLKELKKHARSLGVDQDTIDDLDDHEDMVKIKVAAIELVVLTLLQSMLKEKIKVYWSQDLNKITEIKDKTLIIHDESHSAQSKNNIPYREFYKKHGLKNVLHGDNSQLKERSIWLLNVSATPFSELVCNEKIKQGCLTDDERSIIGDISLSEKSFIFGNPGSDYKGVSDFLENGNVHFESEPIEYESHGHIKMILRKSNYDKKYCLVRTVRADKDRDLMKTIAVNTGCEYRCVFATKKDEDPSEALDFLKEEPSTKILVHLCGKARMGQVLDKTYIGMVYEQTKNPNTDTILQGLLGRMCGYYDKPVPDIYVSPKTESPVKVYAEAWNANKIEKFYEVRKAMNLKGSNKHTSGNVVYDKDKKPWIKTVPIQFTIDECKGDGEASYASTETNDIINMFQDKPEIIEGNPDKAKILEILCERTIYKRDIGQRSYIERGPGGIKQTLENSVKEGNRETCWFSNCVTEFNSVDVKPLHIIGSDKTAYNQEGVIFLIGYVPYDQSIHENMDIYLPEVHKKCNYSISKVETEDGEQIDDINGGQVIPFPFESSTNQQLFSKELKKAILRTDPLDITFIENCQKKIMSMHDKPSGAPNGISLSTNVYNLSLINNIVKDVEGRCNVRISLHKSRGRQPTGYIRYASISWCDGFHIGN